jgi:hypothetical protein
LERRATRKVRQECQVPAWSKQRKTTSGADSRYGTLPYIALSYTWGDAQDTAPIQVAGKVKMVTKNLRDALAALRAEPKTASLPVWADAVCINQDDIAERSQEVKRMADIYRSAASVIVWLGYVPTTWNFYGLQPTDNVNYISPRLLVQQKVEATNSGQQDDYTSDEVLTLVAIFDRPYWRRIWILQELVSARFKDIFFFWAGGLRHISVLHGINHSFSEVVNAWLGSQDVTTFLKSTSASENRVTRKGPEESSSGGNLEDRKWRAELMGTSASRARAKLVQTNRTSDIADKVMQAVTTGEQMELSDYLRKHSTSDIAQRLMQASFTGEKVDVKDYVQKDSSHNSCTSSSTIKQELHNMASGMEHELRNMEELLQALKMVVNDEGWQLKRTEMKLAVNELSITAIDIISAASLDKSKAKIDFGLLMRHALHGQCTNKSDLVYGLLGLHLPEIVSQITVDYYLSSERAFSDFSAAVIRSRGLNFLCDYRANLPGMSSNLPSWVVDLSKDSKHGIMEGEWSQKWGNFGAGGVRRDHIQFSAENGQLFCPGLLYRVNLKTPQPNYRSRDLIRQALERMVSCYHPDEEARRSILNISPQSISNDPEVIASLELCRAFRAVHSELAIEGLQLKDLFPVLDDIVEWDIEAASKALKSVSSQIIFTTMDGKLGLGADNIRDGDYIAVLQGCNVPAILRERKGGYGFIGMCYLDGLMLGEALGANTEWKQLTIL